MDKTQSYTEEYTRVLLTNALLFVCRAYQGVGDFEGTGERMVEVMPIVREALDKAGVKWGGAVTD